MRAWYRVRQFLQALAAPPQAEAPPELPPGLRELFLRLPRADQAHGLRTRRRLAALGETPADALDPALGETPANALNAALGDMPADALNAALLHDVGKGLPRIHLWDRVLFVLAARYAPDWLESAGAAGLVALREHAGRGARLAAEAGAQPLVVALIGEHHTDAARLDWPPAERRLLEALQQADDRS